jgi:hypothetical protein
LRASNSLYSRTSYALKSIRPDVTNITLKTGYTLNTSASDTLGASDSLRAKISLIASRASRAYTTITTEWKRHV